MGNRPSAQLVYGIKAFSHEDDREQPPWAEDFNTAIAAANGLPHPGSDATPSDWNSYFGKQGGIIKTAGVTLEHCGYWDCGIVFICSRVFMEYGVASLVIDPASMVTTAEDDARIEAACKIVGVPFTKPQWHLLPFYG